MASVPENPVPTPAPSADRLWAEQLAMGMALLVGILIFLALFHARMLSTGVAILGPNDLDAYGWASVLGIFLQVVVHELGTIVVAWRLKLARIARRSWNIVRATFGSMPWWASRAR